MSKFQALFAVVMLSVGTSQAAEEIRTMDLAGQRVMLEVATTPAEQRKGLMYRTSLPENHGMLFVIEPPRSVAMWMKNTRMDLDAAFFDSCGKLLNVQTMKQNTLELHHSLGKAAFVVEMESGWFERNQMTPGIIVQEFVRGQYCPKTLIDQIQARKKAENL